MGWLFKKRKEEEVKIDEFEEKPGGEMNFDVVIAQIVALTSKAQVTFLYRLIGVLPYKVIQTLKTYVINRLTNGKDAHIRQKHYHIDRETKSGTNTG